MSKIYLLCEEYEGDNGIREFNILMASHDSIWLEKELEELVEKDEYGFFENNGVSYSCDTMVQSGFEDGFVEYLIIEQEITVPDWEEDETMPEDEISTKPYEDKAFEVHSVINDIITEACKNKIRWDEAIQQMKAELETLEEVPEYEIS